MTQPEILANRAKLAVRQSAINYDLGELDAKMWLLKNQHAVLSAENTSLNNQRAKLDLFENEMRQKGEWK